MPFQPGLITTVGKQRCNIVTLINNGNDDRGYLCRDEHV